MNTETLSPPETPPSANGDIETHDAAVEMAPLSIHLKNILVPLDFSEISLKALQYAVPFAMQFGAKLTLLHVVALPAYTPELPCPPPLGPEHHEAVQKQLEDIRMAKIPAGIPVDTAVRHSFVYDGIIEVAREIHADLIVATTHGYTGLKHMLMGSTAESIVRKAPCPVLVVRELEHDFV